MLGEWNSMGIPVGTAGNDWMYGQGRDGQDTLRIERTNAGAISSADAVAALDAIFAAGTDADGYHHVTAMAA